MGAAPSVLCDKIRDEVPEETDAAHSKTSLQNVEVDQIEISVTEIARGDDASSADYHFLIRCLFKDMNERIWTSNPTVTRTISDFCILRRLLRQRFPHLLIAPTPQASSHLLQGYFSSSQIISFLATDAENFIAFSLKNSEILHNEAFLAFLIVGESEWRHFSQLHVSSSKREDQLIDYLSDSSALVGDEQKALFNIRTKLDLLSEAIEAIEVSSWDAIESTGAAANSSYEGKLLSALDAFLLRSSTQEACQGQKSGSDTILSIGQSFKTGQHFALLALHFEASRCRHWVNSGIEVTAEGGIMLRKIFKANEAAEIATTSYRTKQLHQQKLKEAKETLLDAEDRNPITGATVGTMAIGQGFYHELAASLCTSKTEMHKKERILETAIKNYISWKASAFVGLEVLSEALCEVSKNIVLRWIELERCRLIEHSEKYGAFVVDTCEPFARPETTEETTEEAMGRMESEELGAMIGAPLKTFVGDLHRASIRPPFAAEED